MPTRKQALLGALADFRFQLRTFQHWSEQAAHDAGLQPRQHQLLLQLAGAPPGAVPTVAFAAERLGLRHNSTVELVDRCVAENLLERTEDPGDRRRVLLRLTPHGTAVLDQLSAFHARELHELAPTLLRSLRKVSRMAAAQQTAKRARA